MDRVVSIIKNSFGGNPNEEAQGPSSGEAPQEAAPPVAEAQAVEEEEEDVDLGPPRIGDKCQVLWRDGKQSLTVKVVERRPANYRKRKMKEEIPDVEGLKAEEIDYYVHYEGHDR